MKVSELMSARVESVAPHVNLRSAARHMKETGVGALPVVEDGKLLGIITDRDLACFAIAMGHDLNSEPVTKVMSKEVVSCRPDQDIEEAAALMEKHHIRRLLVVNPDNSLAGFFSVDDLVRGSHELAGAVLASATALH